MALKNNHLLPHNIDPNTGDTNQEVESNYKADPFAPEARTFGGLKVGETKHDKYVDISRAEEDQSYLNEFRANDQSGAELFGKFLGQMGVEATVGALEGVAYAMDFEELLDHEKQSQEGFDNWAAKGIREFKEEFQDDYLKIYQTEEAQHGSLGQKMSDPTWWASQGKTAGTTLSLMFPAMGVAGIAGKVGKGLRISNELAQVGLKGTSAAMFSRKAESAMEANQQFQEQYQVGLQDEKIINEAFININPRLEEIKNELNSLNETLYNPASEDFNILQAEKEERINQLSNEAQELVKIGEQNIDQLSRERAGEIASKTFKANAAMLPLDILQYSMLLKPLSGLKKSIDAISKGKFAKVAGAAIVQPASEALEEGYQFAVGEESTGSVDEGYEMFGEGFGSRMSEYAKDPHFHESIALGGLMGLVFSSGGPAARATADFVSKTGNALQTKKIAKDPAKIEKVYNENRGNFVSKSLVNDNVDRSISDLQAGLEEIEKNNDLTYDEKAESKIQYESLIGDLNDAKKFDSELISEDAYTDNQQLRNQYVLAKIDKKHVDESINKYDKEYKEEISALSSDTSMPDLTPVPSSSKEELNQLRVQLIEANAVKQGLEKAKKTNQRSSKKEVSTKQKESIDKYIDGKISEAEFIIENNTKELKAKSTDFSKSKLAPANIEKINNSRANLIENQIKNEAIIAPTIAGFQNLTKEQADSKENTVTKELIDSANELVNEKIEEKISQNLPLEEYEKILNEAYDDPNVSKEIKDNLSQKVQSLKIKDDIVKIKKEGRSAKVAKIEADSRELIQSEEDAEFLYAYTDRMTEMKDIEDEAVTVINELSGKSDKASINARLSAFEDIKFADSRKNFLKEEKDLRFGQEVMQEVDDIAFEPIPEEKAPIKQYTVSKESVIARKGETGTFVKENKKGDKVQLEFSDGKKVFVDKAELSEAEDVEVEEQEQTQEAPAEVPKDVQPGEVPSVEEQSPTPKDEGLNAEELGEITDSYMAEQGIYDAIDTEMTIEANDSGSKKVDDIQPTEETVDKIEEGDTYEDLNKPVREQTKATSLATKFDYKPRKTKSGEPTKKLYKVDAHDEVTGKLIVTDNHLLETAIPGKFVTGEKVVISVDHSYLSKNKDKISESDLPIQIQTEEDFKNGEKPYLWVRSTNPNPADKKLRKAAYDVLVKDGKVIPNAGIVTTIEYVSSGFTLKSKEEKPIGDQLKIDGKYTDDAHIATGNYNKEIITYDNNNNVIKAEKTKSNFNGASYVMVKSSNNKWYPIVIRQKAINNSKFDGIREEWTSTSKNLILEFVKGNKIFENSIDYLRSEVGKYFNLNNADAKASEIELPGKQGYNTYFGFKRNDKSDNPNSYVLRLPGTKLGKKKYAYQKFILTKVGNDVKIERFSGERGYVQVPMEEFDVYFRESLSNKFPNIKNISSSEARNNFKRLVYNKGKLEWKEEGHYYDFLSDNRIAETRVYGEKTSSGKIVFTASPNIYVNNNVDQGNAEITGDTNEKSAKSVENSGFMAVDEVLSEMNDIIKNKDLTEDQELEIENNIDNNEDDSSTEYIPTELDDMYRIGNNKTIDFKESSEGFTNPFADDLPALNEIDFDNASLEDFDANQDVVNTILTAVLRNLDKQKALTGYNNLEEAIKQAKAGLNAYKARYEHFSKKDVSVEVAEKNGVYTSAKVNKAFASNIGVVLQKFEKQDGFVGFNDLVKLKFDSLKFNSLIEIDESLINEAEDEDNATTGESYAEGKSFKLDPESSMSARVRRIFYDVPKRDALGNEIVNPIGMPSYIDSGAVFNFVIDNTVNVDVNDIIPELRKLAADNYIIKDVVDKLDVLEKESPEIVNNFITVMKKQRADFITLKYEFAKDERSLPTVKILNTNRGGVSDELVSNWVEQFVSKLSASNDIITTDDNYSLDKTYASKKAKEFNSIKAENYKDDFVKILDSIGISFSGNAYDRLKSDFEAKGKYFTKRFGNNSVETDFDKFMDKAFGPIFTDSIKKGKIPFKEQSGAIKNLAFYQSKFEQDATTRMFKNANGDNIYGYVAPTHISNLFDKISSDTPEGRAKVEELMRDPFVSKSTILNSISRYNEYLSSGNELNETEKKHFEHLSEEVKAMKLMYFDASKNDVKGSFARNYERQSAIEKELTKVSLFFNNEANAGVFFNPTASDKTTFSLMRMLKFETSSLIFEDGKLSRSTNDELKYQGDQLERNMSDVFIKAEINRINQASLLFEEAKNNEEEKGEDAYSELIEGYHYVKVGKGSSAKYVPGSSAYFFFIPSLNKTINELNVRNPKTGRISINQEQSNELFNEMKSSIADLIGEKLDQWKESGIINKNGTFSKIDRGIPKKYDNPSKLAVDYTINSMFALSNEFMLATGDPAKFGKIKRFDGKFESYNSVLDQTQANMFKRIAKDIAPGTEGNWTVRDYTMLMIKDPTVTSSLAEYNSKLKKAYSDIDSADAQEWTTLEEHANVLRAFGQINSKEYDDIIENKDNLNVAQLAKVMQPMKPVQVLNKLDPKLRETIPYYIKTSSFPLLPQVTKHFPELDRMRSIMEKNGINRMAPKTAVKTGFRNEVDLSNPAFFEEDGFTFKEGLRDKHVHVFDRSGFRIQQDVPYDIGKEKILESSQFRKLITSNLFDESNIGYDFNYKGTDYKGHELKEKLDTIHVEIYKRKFEKLLDKLGAKRTAEGISIPNVEKLKGMMRDEAIKKGYGVDDILALNTLEFNGNTVFDIPLYFNPMVHKIESILTSMVSNEVLKSKLPGKSFVQGSAHGFKAATEDFLKEFGQNDGIIYSKDYNPETGLDSRIVDGELHAEIFIPLPFKTNKNGKKVPINVNEFTTDGFLDPDKIDPELLEMIGIRIPNQKYSSDIRLKVVGFLPEKSGDLVIVPGSLAIQMGSDFDVDKLYIHWFNYKTKYDYDAINEASAEKLSDDEISTLSYIQEHLRDVDIDIWTDEQVAIYNKFNKIKSLIKGDFIKKIEKLNTDGDIKDLSTEQLQNIKLEIAHVVLKNKEIVKQTVTPLDNSDIADVISKNRDTDSAKEKIKAIKEKINEEGFSALTNAELRELSITDLRKESTSKSKMYNSVLNDNLHSDMVEIQAAGKAGVGILSVASTMHVLSQYSGLYLKDENLSRSIKFSLKNDKTNEFNDNDSVEVKDGLFYPKENSTDKRNSYSQVAVEGAWRLDKVTGFMKNSDGDYKLISDVLTNIQTESVDNANNRLLHPMNLNSTTFDVATLIARAGFDEQFIGFFLNQPAVLDYVEKMGALNRFDEKEFETDRIKKFQSSILSNYGVNVSFENVDKMDISNISLESMAESLTGADIEGFQGSVLKNFIMYDYISKNLNDIQKTANIDTKYLGSDINGVLSKRNEYNKAFGKNDPGYIGNGENLHKKEDKETTQGSAFVLGILNSIDIYKNVMPIDSVLINSLTGKTEKLLGREMKSDEFLEFNIGLRNAIYGEAVKSVFGIENIEAYRKKLLFGENSLGNRLAKYKKDARNKSTFIKSLTVNFQADETKPVTITHISSKNDKNELNLEKELDWNRMLKKRKDSTEYKLAFDLMIYSLTFGTQRTANDFGRFLPSDFYKSSGISQFLRNFDFENIESNETTEKFDQNFLLQFVQHNPRYAKTLAKGVIDSEKNGIMTLKENSPTPYIYKRYNSDINDYDLFKREKGYKYKKVGTLGYDNELTQYNLDIKYGKIKGLTPDTGVSTTPVEKSTTEEILKSVNFNKGTIAVLSSLANSSSTDGRKELAKFYLKNKELLNDSELQFFDKNNPLHAGTDLKYGPKGRYKSESNIVIVNKSRIDSKEDFEHTFLHEVTHALTSVLIENKSKLSKDQQIAIDNLDKIRNDVSGKLKDDPRFNYFLGSTKEFVAGVMSNEQFQAELTKLNYKKEVSLMSEILNLIKKILGMDINKKSTLAYALNNSILLIQGGNVAQVNELRAGSSIKGATDSLIDQAVEIMEKCKGDNK